MTPQQVVKAKATLMAVLDGHTYADLAAREGVWPSALERRVRALDLALRNGVGVEGVPVGCAVSLYEMRKHKGSYLQAIERYAPSRVPRTSEYPVDAVTLERILHVAGTWSMSPLRDIAMVQVLFCTAIRPIEIALLEIADFLQRDGSVRTDSVVQPEIAFNGRERPLCFVQEDCNNAVLAYLAHRYERGFGVTSRRAYSGFNPRSKLFVAIDGASFKVRVTETAKSTHRACPAVNTLFTTLFARAGAHGVTALSARRTAAQNLRDKGYDYEVIGRVLGISRRSARALVRLKRPSLFAAVRDLAPR